MSDDFFSEEQLTDPLIKQFVNMHLAVSKAEKDSDPDTWSDEMNAAYGSDWKAFSRLRGYTEEEIGQFEKWIDTANAVTDKYGEDFSCELNFLCNESYISNPP